MGPNPASSSELRHQRHGQALKACHGFEWGIKQGGGGSWGQAEDQGNETISAYVSVRFEIGKQNDRTRADILKTAAVKTASQRETVSFPLLVEPRSQRDEEAPRGHLTPSSSLWANLFVKKKINT